MNLEHLAADVIDRIESSAVQNPETLVMPYIENWCQIHQTTSRLTDALARIPPM
jgi:hypothetical protein